MLKRTLFFGSPGKLSVKNKLLFYEAADTDAEPRSFAVEDIGFIVIESRQIVLTSYVIGTLAEHNVAVVFCDGSHLPSVQMVPYSGNALTQKIAEFQFSASEAVKGRLWKQTVQAKLRNQAECLQRLGCEYEKIAALCKSVKNGDPGNVEAVGARFYFQQLGTDVDFIRERFGAAPNNALNYGYAILRAATARAIVGSGLSCVAGIHHCNQYNAFALADDVMEPYRPFVDETVFGKIEFFDVPELNRAQKAELLRILVRDVKIRNECRPLSNALSYTTASLVRCLAREEAAIAYPEFC